MKRTMKATRNGLKIAAIYGSVFLGAGFASGQELLQYFVGFGPIGLVGLMAAGALFALTGWAVLRVCSRHGIDSYHGLMGHLFGEKLGWVMEGLVAAFLFCLFVAMLAGAGATGRQAFNLPFSIGALAVGLCVFIVLRFGLTGIVKINVWLAPFMLFGGIFIGLFTYFTQAAPVFASFFGGKLGVAWLLSAMVYASYNLVTGVPILAATASMVKGRQDAAVGGLLGGGIITFLGICMALPLFLHYGQAAGLEIPFLYIVTRHGGGFRLFYLTVLLAAIITTAACNAFAVSEWLRARGFSGRIKMAAALCAIGVAASHVGFANIVAYVYPAFGFLGLFKVMVVLWHGFWYTKH
ncbi:MAG: hypothetical protein FWG38_06450 [Defluviitaleaceae bacterium]|nr:hypothetical protein [Defluviitaleaceae bacterium]